VDLLPASRCAEQGRYGAVAFRIRFRGEREVTRAGIVYVIATLLIGIAALNTGNNLLYIVVAAMLAAILVSGLVSAVILQERPATRRRALRGSREGDWRQAFGPQE
jgi:hypothetical protein